jgi:hypothetical protein
MTTESEVRARPGRCGGGGAVSAWPQASIHQPRPQMQVNRSAWIRCVRARVLGILFDPHRTPGRFGRHYNHYMCLLSALAHRMYV